MSGPNSAGALLLGVAAGRRGCGRRVGGDTKPCQSRGPRGRWQWGGRGVRQGASDAAELVAAVGRDRARSHLARGGGGTDRAAWGRAWTVREVGIRVLYGCFIGRSGRTGEGVTAVPHWAELGGGYCSAAHQQEKPHLNRSNRGGRRHHLSQPRNLPAPARCLAGVGLDSARPTLARRPYTLNRGRRWGMTPLAPYRYRTGRGRVQEGERPRAFSKRLPVAGLAAAGPHPPGAL